MASLRLSISFDTRDSKKLKNPSIKTVHSQPLDRSATLLISSLVSVHRAFNFVSNSSSVGKVGNFPFRVSHIETRVSDTKLENVSVRSMENDCSIAVRDGLMDKNPSFRYEGESGSESEGKVESVGKAVKQKRKLDSGYRRVNYAKKRVDLDRIRIDSGMSLEKCNFVLKQLEKGSDSEALRFFEWMRSNGKLRGNLDAFNLVLRVLARREDWDAVQKIVCKMRGESGCELSFRIFNTLIYACCKKGQVELGGKWFKMMLEYGVQPNIATFGMLMGLYQKGWKVEEAEFAFAQMRKCGIKCEAAYSAMITIYTRLRLYDKAEEVIGLMREDRVVLNLENWLVLLNAYCQQGKLKDAEEILVLMQNSGFSSNLVAYNTLITGYGKVSNMDAAQKIFQALPSFGLEPDETTYRSMIEGWGRAGDYAEAYWYYQELRRLGMKPNASNLFTMIKLQAKHGDEDGAAKTLNDMIEMGCQYSSIMGTLLQAYERAGRIDKVPLLLKGPLYQHVLVSQTSCSMLAMAYVKNYLVNDAVGILENKKWIDPAFEDNLYHLLICSCKESGHLDDAVRIYNQFCGSVDKPNLHIVCTMIDVYTLMGLFTEAEKLYKKLKSAAVSLDMVAYSIILRMYIKSGSVMDACSVLESMEKQKNIVPDIYLYRDMLRVYQKSGMVDKLSALYYEILKSGIVWDQEMYNCVINCCSRALSVDELSRLFDEMLHHGYAPNTITCNVMIDVYAKSKLFKKAKMVFLMAKNQGLIDVISYNTIIAAYGRNKDFKRMKSAVRAMQFNGFSVSLEAYNCLLDAYGKEGQMESFREVLQRMKESSCTSDQYTYNIMINIYGEQGWIDEVASVLEELKRHGLGPDLYSYNTLIKAYGIAGMVEDAVALVKEMRQKGVEPDKISYVNLINALKRNDKFLEAVKWSLWMKQMGV